MEENSSEFLIKIHKSYRWVVAICDAELKDQIFESGNRQIDLSVPFFNGDLVNITQLNLEVERAKNEDATFYIVGQNSIEFAKGINLVDDEGISKVNGIPYALVLL